MIKSKEDNPQPLEIDLTGPEGNAYVLLGHAKNLCKELNIDWDTVYTDMTSSDYENLVQVFDDNFGHIVTLYR